LVKLTTLGAKALPRLQGIPSSPSASRRLAFGTMIAVYSKLHDLARYILNETAIPAATNLDGSDEHGSTTTGCSSEAAMLGGTRSRDAPGIRGISTSPHIPGYTSIHTRDLVVKGCRAIEGIDGREEGRSSSRVSSDRCPGLSVACRRPHCGHGILLVAQGAWESVKCSERVCNTVAPLLRLHPRSQIMAPRPTQRSVAVPSSPDSQMSTRWAARA